MTTRTELTASRPATPPLEQKVLTDQEIDDILDESLKEMGMKESSTTPPKRAPLAAPLQSELTNNDEQIMQLLRGLQSGNTDLGEIDIEQVLRQINPEMARTMREMMQDPETQIRAAIQLYETDPRQLEAGFRNSSMLQEIMSQEPNPFEEIIPFPDTTEGLKKVKLFSMLLTAEDKRSRQQAQQSFMQTGNPEVIQRYFDRLVQEKKAEYVAVENAPTTPEKEEMGSKLQELGIDAKLIEFMLNHKDLRVALDVMGFAVLSDNKELVAPFTSFIAKSAAGLEVSSFFDFIKTLPEQRVREIKEQCIAFLKRRLNL